MWNLNKWLLCKCQTMEDSERKKLKKKIKKVLFLTLWDIVPVIFTTT